MKNKFMEAAVKLSMKNREGGPFGAVVVLNGEIIGGGKNVVVSTNDPTAHAEIMAIRDACKNIGNFSLENAEIYTSCEPCPMCLAAIYWARIKRVYYSNTRKDAADINFDDSYIYDQIKLDLEKRDIELIQIKNNEAIKAFQDWESRSDKIEY